jgi:DNA-binding transcriptional ArsR family regulator
MEMAGIFRALADPTRLAVFENVMREEVSVNELTSRFEVSQPAISQHLAVLRGCGLVAQRREGRQMFYRAEPAGLKPVVSWINEYRAFWRERLPRLKTVLKEMRDE